MGLFRAVYTGTRPGVPPPSGRGRGGEDAGSLLPGVLPPELVASYARAWSDTPCRQSFCTTHTTHHTTTHHNNTTTTPHRDRHTERDIERKGDERQEDKRIEERREKREDPFSVWWCMAVFCRCSDCLVKPVKRPIH